MLPTLHADTTYPFRRRAPSQPPGNRGPRDGLIAAGMLDKDRLSHLLRLSAQGLKCFGAEVDPKPEMRLQINALLEKLVEPNRRDSGMMNRKTAVNSRSRKRGCQSCCDRTTLDRETAR
jgi:hypothetical protein